MEAIVFICISLFVKYDRSVFRSSSDYKKNIVKYRKKFFILFTAVFTFLLIANQILFFYLSGSGTSCFWSILVLLSNFILLLLFFHILSFGKNNLSKIDLVQENEARLLKELREKDLVLDSERQVLEEKNSRLEGTLREQKKVNDDILKLKRDYKKVIDINNAIWLMDDPIEILEEVCQTSMEASGAERSMIVILDGSGKVSFIGSSICSVEDKRLLADSAGTKFLDAPLAQVLSQSRYIRLDKIEVPGPVGAFLGCDRCYAFPIIFRNGFHGAAFYRMPDDSTLPASSLSAVEMFLSIVAVYFERSELVRKELELASQLSEKEKLSSISRLIDGIAHNMNSPINSISLSQEMVSLCLDELRGRYGEDPFLERISRANARVARAVESVNAIVRTFSKKSLMDREENADLININDLVTNEIAFLDADMEFKHNFQKEVVLESSLPSIWGRYRDFSYLFETLVYYAMALLEENGGRKIVFRTRSEAGSVCIDAVFPEDFQHPDTELIAVHPDRRLLEGVNVSNITETLREYNIGKSSFVENGRVVLCYKIPVKTSN